MTLSLGPCARRSLSVERLESHNATDEDLARIFDWIETVDRWGGGYQSAVGFLDGCSARWSSPVPVTILNLGCGRGDLSKTVARWARRRKLEVRIHATDKWGRWVQMARERHRSLSEITFEVRDLSDPFFLQAHQFDYVISSLSLHHENDDRVLAYLKVLNRLARRGVYLSDWLRDTRGFVWLSSLARLYRNEAVRHDAGLAVRRGFTIGEIAELAKKAGLEFALIQKRFGYRFSLSGERATVLSAGMQPWAGLAGA